MSSAAPKEIRSLNTVRGVAALMVAVYHAPGVFGVRSTFPHAYLAVDLFFVLSGFVLVHAYGARIEQGLSLGRFIKLRFARLYPLLALATLAGCALWLSKVGAHKAHFEPVRMAALWRNLLLIPASEAADPNHAAFPFVIQSWSIVWEMGLSLMLFAWLKFLRRGAAVFAGSAALLLAVLAYFHGHLDGGWTTVNFGTGGARALFAFWAGVVVRQATEGRTQAPRALNLAASVAGGLVLAYVVFVHKTWWLADYAAAVAAFPLILAATSLSRRKWLENSIGDRLGEASYSVYLLHCLTIDIVCTRLHDMTPLSPAAHMALGFGWMAVLVAAAWVSWRWVETPLRKLFSRPWRPAPASVLAQA